jgi:hypothetical protein
MNINYTNLIVKAVLCRVGSKIIMIFKQLQYLYFFYLEHIFSKIFFCCIWYILVFQSCITYNYRIVILHIPYRNYKKICYTHYFININY